MKFFSDVFNRGKDRPADEQVIADVAAPLQALPFVADVVPFLDNVAGALNARAQYDTVSDHTLSVTLDFDHGVSTVRFDLRLDPTGVNYAVFETGDSTTDKTKYEKSFWRHRDVTFEVKCMTSVEVVDVMADYIKEQIVESYGEVAATSRTSRVDREHARWKSGDETPAHQQKSGSVSVPVADASKQPLTISPLNIINIRGHDR